MPAATAFGILHDLHLLCTANKNQVSREELKRLTNPQAKRAYCLSLAYVIASFTVMNPVEQRASFGTLLQFCTEKESMGGLESVFLTLMLSLSRAEQATEADSPPEPEIGERLWERLGPPRVMGGGYHFGFFFDSATNCMTRLGRASLVSLGSARLASLLAGGAGLATAGPAPTEDAAGLLGAELARAVAAVAGTPPGIGSNLAVGAFPAASIPGIGGGGGTTPPGGAGTPGVGNCPPLCPDAAKTCCLCCSCCCCCGGSCGALPDSGAYRSALLILGATSLATSSLLSPVSARAFAIQTGPLTSLIIRLPALRPEPQN